jgi:hypothetical protein
LKSLQRNTQPATLTELQTIEVPLRVLVTEPDVTSRRLICALLQSAGKTMVRCVEDSELLSAIHETDPHIVIVDVYSPSIRRALDCRARSSARACDYRNCFRSLSTVDIRFECRGPGYFDTDFGMEKSFNVPKWETAQLAVGARFFNLFNHPNFAFPNTNADSGQFGQPTTIYGSGLGADASPRVIELQAKFVF